MFVPIVTVALTLRPMAPFVLARAFLTKHKTCVAVPLSGIFYVLFISTVFFKDKLNVCMYCI